MGKLYIKNRYGQVPVELLNRPDLNVCLLIPPCVAFLYLLGLRKGGDSWI